jgi:hypothetical protein
MAKKERIERSIGDKRAMLREQILLLNSYADSYDAGQRAFAKPMAASLRLLIHHHRNSISLLHQLGLRQGRFFAVVKKVSTKNLLTECNLLVTHFTGNRAHYVAWTAPLDLRQRLSFPEWWSAPVLKGHSGITMCRRDVITAVADMDGGAHVDPSLEKVYHLFRTGELIGWGVVKNEMGIGFLVPMADSEPVNGEIMAEPQYACVRTITHEFLLTMQKYAPWSFDKPYVPKYNTEFQGAVQVCL